jgi:hypothetical protein
VDRTSSEGLLAAELEPFSEVASIERGFATTQARITNVSSDSIVLNGEGGEELFGFLTTEDGDVLSAPPEDANAAAARASLAPGDTIEWPVYLSLEKGCGGADIESGSYQMQLLYRLSEPSDRNVLSTEALPVEIL